MNLLQYAGGAAEGLDAYLKEALAEEETKRRNRALEEETRSNRANESLRSRQIDITGEQNRINQENLNQYRKQQDENADLGRVRQTLDLQPIGAEVTPEAKALQIKAGASPANYFNPILPGLSTPEGDKPNQEGIGYWKGTQNQIEAERRDAKENAAQQKDYTVNGKHVVGFFDPKTRQITSGTGEDITATAVPYERPQQPAISIMQTDEGLVRVPKGGGPASKVTLGDGTSLGPTLPSQERLRIDTAPKMAAHIPEMKNLIEGLDKDGQLGPGMGRWNDLLANKIGSTGDPDLDYRMGRLGFGMKGLISGFINIHAGTRGAASDRLSQMWTDIANSKTMSKDRLFGALDEEESWLKTYGTGPNKGGQPQGGGDMYQEYLNRTKPKQ